MTDLDELLDSEEGGDGGSNTKKVLLAVGVGGAALFAASKIGARKNPSVVGEAAAGVLAVGVVLGGTYLFIRHREAKTREAEAEAIRQQEENVRLALSQGATAEQAARLRQQQVKRSTPAWWVAPLNWLSPAGALTQGALNAIVK